jgi:hypothetical protein
MGNPPLDPEEVGRRATKKKSRMFNFDILKEIHFWRDFLCDNEPRIVCSFGAQHLVLNSQLMSTTVSWPGVPESYRQEYRNAEIKDNLFTAALLDSIEEKDESDDWDEQDLEFEDDTE